MYQKNRISFGKIVLILISPTPSHVKQEDHQRLVLWNWRLHFVVNCNNLSLVKARIQKGLSHKNLCFFLYSMLPYKFCWTNKPNGEPFFGQGHSIVRYSNCPPPPCPFIVKGHVPQVETLTWKMLLGFWSNKIKKYIHMYKSVSYL